MQTRAETICRTQFATCAVSRALIDEVADAGPLGAMAQAYLPASKTRAAPRHAPWSFDPPPSIGAIVAIAGAFVVFSMLVVPIIKFNELRGDALRISSA